ncbi:hypothetical protein ABI59_02460 [Acidobacteria bacterium Mor1]|nr:hypothetical protein ABI59_02460 [Acidobacteria bacterium Mor1]
MPEPLGYILLFGAGLIAGALNVIAGGGSFLTLPILIFLGLPPTVANGTNRVGILLQNVGAVWGFRRHNVLDTRDWAWVLIPAVAGSVAGTALALWVGDAAFQRILASLMIVATLGSLWSPRIGGEGRAGLSRGPLALGFLVAGVYGGFVQAGVGFLILTVTSLAGLDLVRGNALKVFCILAFTGVSLAIFAWSGKVEWIPGLALAGGTILGGQLGVRWTVQKGHAWIRGVVTVAVLAMAVLLWLR